MSVPPPPPGSDIPPQTPIGGAPGYGSAVSQDDRTMAMLAQLLGILGFIGPLIIWLIKKDQSKFIAFHSLQALIFHVAIDLIIFALGITVILAIASPILWIVGVVFAIIGGLAANRGEWYELPVAAKFARQQVGI